MVQRYVWKSEHLNINKMTEQSRVEWDGTSAVFPTNLMLKVYDRMNLAGITHPVGSRW